MCLWSVDLTTYIQIQNYKMQMKTPYIGIDKTCYYDMFRNLNLKE